MFKRQHSPYLAGSNGGASQRNALQLFNPNFVVQRVSEETRTTVTANIVNFPDDWYADVLECRLKKIEWGKVGARAT